jgi:hypothetical protein
LCHSLVLSEKIAAMQRFIYSLCQPAMKPLILLLVITGIIFTSCNKEATSSSLTGNWRLVEVYDKNTSSTMTPPAEDGNDLVLKFNTTGFSGHTLRNTISEGEYTVPELNKIRFGGYSITEVNEEIYGGVLLTVLSACSLQSVYPCVPLDFTVLGNMLEIDTPLRYKIKLKKI